MFSARLFHLVLAAVLLFLFILVVLHTPQTQPHFALLLCYPVRGDAKELPHSLDGEAVSGLTVSEGHARVGSLNGVAMRQDAEGSLGGSVKGGARKEGGPPGHWRHRLLLLYDSERGRRCRSRGTWH